MTHDKNTKETKEKPPAGHCPECGTKFKRCPFCGSQYCPECEPYHLEECRDAARG